MRESEERFRSLVQNAPDVITLLGADGTILYESPSVERILGYAPEDLVGENAFDYLHPNDSGRVFGVFADVLLDPREVLSPVAYRFRRKDGSWCHLEATGSNQLDNPSVGAIVINSRDVTERKEAEDAMRTSEARFQAVFENAAVGMALVDMEGRLTEGDLALQEMLGYGDEDLRGMMWVELTHPDDVELDRSHFERLVAGELDRYRFEKRYVRKDGRVIWGQLTGSVIRGAEDEPRLMIGMVEDVTERKRAEEALRESQDLLQAVMEGTTDAIYVKDLRGRYLMANSACARVLGRTVEEVIGKDDAELFSPEDGREVMEDDRDIMATGKPRTSEDTKTAGNARRTYLITKGPYRDHEGKIAGVFGVSRDITERKRAEEALKESEERFRGAFEGAAVGVALVGLDMRYLRVNRALCEMLGYPEEELPRKTSPDLIQPEDREISEERAPGQRGRAAELRP